MPEESFVHAVADKCQSSLCIGSEGDTGADLAETWCSFVYLDVDMWVFEQTDGKSQPADTTADNCETVSGGFGRNAICLMWNTTHGWICNVLKQERSRKLCDA